MHHEPPPSERQFLLDEMALCPPAVRAPLMADHTTHDWRDLLSHLHVPALVLVARQDSTFPWQGPAWVGEQMPHAHTMFFEDSSHMLFHDEPDTFNRTLASFLAPTTRQVGTASP